MSPAKLRLLQRAALRLDRGPARRLMDWLYLALAHGYGAYLRFGLRDTSVYLRGTLASGEALHGLSDIDLAVIVAHPGDSSRRRIRSRHERASRSLAPLSWFFEQPVIYDAERLPAAFSESALTYGLGESASGSPPSPRAFRSGPVASGPPGRGTPFAGDEHDQMQLERPELTGSPALWRALAGRDLRPAVLAQTDASTCRVNAWLELQTLWRFAFAAAAEPGRPQTPYVCVKLLAETARIWLWLTAREPVRTRDQALTRGCAALPVEAAAFERARQLHRSLRSSPRAELEEFLPPFLRLSARIAGELGRQVAPAGSTSVELLYCLDGALTLPHGGLPAVAPWSSGGSPLPLADWRGLVYPIEPDESFALIDGDPGDPDTLRMVGLAVDRGTYPTLRGAGLMVRPTPHWGRGRLRAVQCEVTDPVSFAVASEQPVARFPNVAGFSVHDTVRRALAEHAAWLRGAAAERTGTALGRLITAARAALLWQSLTDGDPALAATLAGVLSELAASSPAAASIAADAHQAYVDFAWSWEEPPRQIIERLRQTVLALPAYDTPQPTLPRPS